jgi:Ca-activated chloride channel family protein
MVARFFANPIFLATLLAVPIAVALLMFASIRRKQLAARLAAPIFLRSHLVVSSARRRWQALCVLLGVVLICIACAGPQWGLDPAAQFRKGRDVVLVLDLSRSMNAEQPSRRTVACRALTDLANGFQDQGGNRIALVGYATRARQFFPLTQDCEHLRRMLTFIDAGDYPPLSAENPLSGTRIGAALTLAVESCDGERSHRPVIVLVSDGDDPVDDDEWLDGVKAAADKKIQVHVVGVGNSARAETIPAGNDLLRYGDDIVRTKLNEPRLRDIAKRTGGEFLSPHHLGDQVLRLLDVDDLREAASPGSSSIPIYHLRYAWCLVPALLLFMTAMLINAGPRTPVQWPWLRSPAVAKALAALLTVIALGLISAADPPEVEAVVRRGDDAFARQKFDEARIHYEKAEGLTGDPGRLSFNLGASYYQLGRYREAIECYRRSLEDESMPGARQARAWFYLGNATLQQAGDDAGQLADAVKAYRAALFLLPAQSDLLVPARHNLELAQVRWLKAKERQPVKKTDPLKDPDKSKAPNEKDPKKTTTVLVPIDPIKNAKPEQSEDVPKDAKSKDVHAAGLLVLPDVDKVVPIAPQTTSATLEKEARRIAEERRQQRHPTGPPRLTTKDW